MHEFLPTSVVFVLDDKPEIPPEIESEIECLWTAQQQGRSMPLNNGRILSATSISPGQIVGRIAEYRHYIAQKGRPELFDVLRIRPVAVSGLLECQEGLVFGRRADSVTQYSGSWELVPSGGIDASDLPATGNCDYMAAVLNELREEIGVGKDSVSGMRPCCLVEDLDSHVLDIGIVISSPWSIDMLRGIHCRAGSKEYTDIRVVPIAELNDFADNLTQRLVPVSKVLIEQFLRGR